MPKAMTPADLIATTKALLEKATPGPWEANTLGEASGFVAVNNGHQTIAQWCLPQDAALIAAAPTLLAACVEALEGMEQKLAAQHARHVTENAKETERAWLSKEWWQRRARLWKRAAKELHEDHERLCSTEMQRERRLDAEEEVARLKGQVDDLEVVRAAAYATVGQQSARIAILTAALENARVGVAGDDEYGWVVAAIDAALSQARDGGEGE